MKKSILHNKKDRTCFLCMLLHDDDSIKNNLHEHHVFSGWANRKLSERHGLKVYLCVQHHEIGREAVHQNAEINKMLQAYAQRAFERKFPEKDFRRIFGRNYIMDEKAEEIEPDLVAGFQIIPDGLEGIDW